jgi:hypothetical protein
LIELPVFIFLCGLYFFIDSTNTSLKEAGIAFVVYSIYIVIYKLVTPFSPYPTQYAAKLFGLLPLLSFGAIVFPHFNNHSPEYVTKFLGWVGLTTAFLILCYFKLFMW